MVVNADNSRLRPTENKTLCQNAGFWHSAVTFTFTGKGSQDFTI